MSAINKETDSLLSESSLDSNGSALFPQERHEDDIDFSVVASIGRLFESYHSIERRHALQVPGVGPAAFMIKDAVLGYQDGPYDAFYNPYSGNDELRNIISVICGRVVSSTWAINVVLGANWVLFFLSFFEPPHWCRDSSLAIAKDNVNGSLSEFGDCQHLLNARGTAIDGEENQYYYPSWNVIFLTVSQSKRIELCCISVILAYLVLKLGDDGFRFHFFFYTGYKRFIHTLQITMLLCLSLGVLFDFELLHPFFRMILLGSFLRTFQKELLTMAKMIPAMAYILAILAVVTVFYAWFGVVIFANTDEGAASFENLVEGVWTLWICVTTANYPDVMMPSYNEKRLLPALFFVSYMVISFFYLMNLILAITVNAYDDSIADRRRERKELSKKNLLKAYQILDPENRNAVSRDCIMAVMTILNQDIPEIQLLSKDERGILFAFLDRDGSSQISRDEFLEFGKILLLRLTKQSDYATFVERNLPQLHDSSWYQSFTSLVKSDGFEKVLDFVLVLNAVVIAIQDYPLLIGKDVGEDPHFRDGYIDTVWERLETIFTVIYVLEVAVKVLVNGWKRYSESMRNMFDFLITILALLATAYVYYPNDYSDSRLVQFVVMARVFRLGRLLIAFDSFQMFGTISVDIIPAASSVFLVLLFVLYFFASFGMLLYGGLITRDPQNPLSSVLLEARDFVDNNYWANNFNDMFSGMNVLFNLLVVNNWTEFEIGLEYTTGSKQVRFFFVIFHLFGVIVISNVVTSFIINAYFQQMETVVQRLGWEEDVEGAVIKGQHGVFDATTITGTKTGIPTSSVYIARIAPRHMDIEIDERAALRNLFTRKKTINTMS